MPNLEDCPRYPLGFFPTPLVELKRLSKILTGPQIWMKRDDQTGLAMGGNKTRKLEWLLGDALSAGADAIVTGGAAQSNHCRQTAAAAALYNLECHLALGGTAPDIATGNLLLDRLLGARIHWSGEQRKGETIPHICEQLAAEGKHPYVIPYGGSNTIGAAAFVNAACELQEQLAEMSASITHVVIASSSGGTQAGLMVGQRVCRADWHLVGINIDKDRAEEESFAEAILNLANETAAFLELPAQDFTPDLTLRSEYVGAGYGRVGELEQEAIALLAQTEGILLDPVYTGRAMGALIHMIRTGEFRKEDGVLFWHTGGTPALFAYAADLT